MKENILGERVLESILVGLGTFVPIPHKIFSTSYGKKDFLIHLSNTSIKFIMLTP